MSAGSKEEAGGFLGGRGSRGGGATELGVSAGSKEDAAKLGVYVESKEEVGGAGGVHGSRGGRRICGVREEQEGCVVQ